MYGVKRAKMMSRTLHPDTLNSILKQAGITVEGLQDYL
jgi:hypothetical protein